MFQKGFVTLSAMLICLGNLQPDLNGAHPENSLAKKWLFGIAGVEGGIAAQKKSAEANFSILKSVCDAPADTHIEAS